MSSKLVNRVLGYAIALVATAAAIGLRSAAEPWLSGRLPYLTLFAAVAVAVWRGGLGPALLASAVGFLAVNTLIPNHPGASGPGDITYRFALFGYALSCAVIITFGLSVQRVQRRLQQEAGERQVAERLSAETHNGCARPSTASATVSSSPTWMAGS